MQVGSHAGSHHQLNSPDGPIGIRDAGMAENLVYLARELYPDKRIVTWAHNYHIRYANEATRYAHRTMGSWLVERLRAELYTIGLFMNRGSAAHNNRQVYAIRPAPEGSMEWVLAAAGPASRFVEFLNREPHRGNSWMLNAVLTREWGLNSVQMVPRDQYDGVIFIDLVSPPRYLPN